MDRPVSRFEDLIAWQRARGLVREIYRVSAAGAFARGFGFRDQIRRAAVSVMSNIAEVRSQLYVALDVGYVGEREFGSLLRLARDTASIVNALRGAVAKRKPRTQYR